MMKILIVEDEALIADHLAECLQDEGYEVIGIKDSVIDALDFLSNNKPDLLLLDINLQGDLDGVDLANQLNIKHQLPFIFLTSNTDSKTLSRVKLTAPAGFIVKPFQQEDLKPAIELALFANKSTTTSTILNESDSFFIKEKHEMLKVYYKDINYAEAADNYTVLHTEGKRFTISQTLKKVEEKLEGKGFLRVHRSYLVNVSKISCIRPTELMIGNKNIPVSSGSRQQLLAYVQTF